jgi:hypothetical protein
MTRIVSAAPVRPSEPDTVSKTSSASIFRSWWTMTIPRLWALAIFCRSAIAE